MTRKRLFTIGGIVLAILVAGAFSVGFFRLDYALGAQQVYNNLTIDAELLENGSMRVTEHWQVRYNKRDHPYWNHSIFIGKNIASSVQDFVVYDSDYGRDYTFTPEANAFTAGDRATYLTDGNTWYELGWNFPRIDAGERNFTITYTLTDVALNYADADELNYTFVPEGNSFPVRRFSLVLRFPNRGSQADVHAFLHSDENGTWQLEDSRTLTASVDKIPAHSPVELRLLIPPNSVEGSGFLSDTAILDAALEEEAAGTGFMPDSINRYRHFSVLLSVLGALAAVGIVLFLLLRAERKAKEGLSGEAPLRREMPSCARPAVVNRLYFFEENAPGQDSGEGFAVASTVLSLLHKRWLTLQPGEEEHEVVVGVNSEGKSDPEGEEIILIDLFRVVALKHGGRFSLSEFQAYGKSNTARLGKLLAAYHDAVRRRFIRLGWVRPIRFFNSLAGWACVVSCFLGLITLIFGQFVGKWILVAGLLLAGLLAGCYAAFRLRLTDGGRAELQRWRGFVKYLREYSLLCENPRQELCLWGDYMVYASAFGIAKTVSAELATTYQRLSEETPVAAVSGDNYAPAAPLTNPLDPYFGFQPKKDETLGENDIWLYSSFINEVARTFRGLRQGGSVKGNAGFAGRVNSVLAKIAKRFGAR